MYGLVNRGIRDLMLAKGGEPLWRSVREKAGVDTDDFLSMQAYDDAVSVSLVGVAADEIGVSTEELLREFGRHWVLFTGNEGYGPLMDVSGDTLHAFLNNLDQMHARVRVSMPELDPPSFRVEELAPEKLRIEYFSSRQGLAGMVIGLLEGLGERFGESVSAVHVEAKQSVDEPDVFELVLQTDLSP